MIAVASRHEKRHFLLALLRWPLIELVLLGLYAHKAITYLRRKWAYERELGS